MLIFKLGLDFYPVVSADGKPLMTPENILNIYREGRYKLEGVAESLFLLDQIREVVTHTHMKLGPSFAYGFKAIGVMIISDSEKFFMPIRATDIIAENILPISDISKYLPTIDQVLYFLSKAKRIFEYLKLEVSRAIYEGQEHNKRYYGIVLADESTTVFTKPFKEFPSHLHMADDCKMVHMDRSIFEFLLNNSDEAETTLDPSVDVERSVEIAMLYIADRMGRSLQLTKYAKLLSDRKNMIKIIKSDMSKYISIGRRYNLPLQYGNILKSSKSLTITKSVFDIAISRLIYAAPNDPLFFPLYIVSRSTVVDDNAYWIESGEKIVIRSI